RGRGSTALSPTRRSPSSSRRFSSSMAQVELRGVTKVYGATAAVQGVHLEAKDGEFLTILGPSGCGKTTTLRIIAGLLDPDAGEVLLDGRPVHHLPAHRRETAMVFQSYAPFPHMTVEATVTFRLRVRGVPPGA